MLPYLLVTITILIVIICIAMFYGYRQLNQLSFTVQRHNNDIAALRHILEDGLNHLQHPLEHPMATRHLPNDFPFPQDDTIDEQDEPVMTESDEEDEELPEEEDSHEQNESQQEGSGNLAEELNDLENELNAIEETLEITSEPQQENSDEKEMEMEKEVKGGDEDKVIDLTLSNNKAKKVPDEPAKNYEEGYKMISTNDNNQYIVISNKNGGKRWKKI